MSLAFSAYSLENEDGINNSNPSSESDSYIDTQQKARRNTTQKRRESFSNSTKVDNVLEKLHSSNDDDDDKDIYSPPKSAGTERIEAMENQKSKQESMVNMASKNDLMFRTLGKNPQPNYENGDKVDLNDYSNYGDDKSNEEYYKRMLPGYLQNQPQISQKNINNKPYYSQMNYKPESINTENSVLLQKLNYMITLLEDQQDERTNNVTEEVILYSFLGIFIIFIADTFVRVGKYVR